MNDNQIHTGADDLTHQAMEEALHRRNTAEIRRLLEAGFLLSNAPRTPDGYEQPHYYLKELINYYCFYSHYKELIELLPLFLDRSESLSSLELESIGRIHANEYTKDILRLLIDHVEDINEQNRSGNSILHEKLKDYQNTYAYQSGPDEIVPPEKNEPDIILDLLLERSDLDVNELLRSITSILCLPANNRPYRPQAFRERSRPIRSLWERRKHTVTRGLRQQ